MLFGVIYSIECDQTGLSLEQLRPPISQRETLWQRTEEGESELNSTLETSGWVHEKWCACLDLPQMDEFVDHTGVRAETTDTLGSIGAPTPDGLFSYGASPAISFQDYGDHWDLNAYVTPYPTEEDLSVIEGLDLENLDAAAFELVKEWMVERWEDGTSPTPE